MIETRPTSPLHAPTAAQHSVACVSFLNSKPLIDPLVGRPDTTVHFEVPAKLLTLLDQGLASTGLLSVVDYHTAKHPLILLPSGMIGCDGPTLTVRIFSRIPPQNITTLHVDTDSHTSIILAQVILREQFNTAPRLVDLQPGARPDAMLLIGDKVVNAAPATDDYPHQLDLGEQWKILTGLPFVFACWMQRRDMRDDSLAQLLLEAQQRGAHITDQLLDRYAAEKRWPRELARKYFTQYLRYEVTPAARHGLARFFELTRKHNLLPTQRDLAWAW